MKPSTTRPDIGGIREGEVRRKNFNDIDVTPGNEERSSDCRNPQARLLNYKAKLRDPKHDPGCKAKEND
jgi:hypothetical protein